MLLTLIEKLLPSWGNSDTTSWGGCAGQCGDQHEAKEAWQEGRHFVCFFSLFVVIVLFRVRFRMTCIMGRCFTYTPSLFTFSPSGTYLGLGSPNYTSFSTLPEEATNVQKWPCPWKTSDSVFSSGLCHPLFRIPWAFIGRGVKNNIVRSSHSFFCLEQPQEYSFMPR